MTQVELMYAHAVDCDNYNGRKHLQKALIEAASTITALEAEVARLREDADKSITRVRNRAASTEVSGKQHPKFVEGLRCAANMFASDMHDAAMRGDGGEDV